MGLMDRVRDQAAQLAQKTQEAAQEGRVMLDQAQARRRADAMFRDLGAAVYAERTGRGGPDGAAKIDRLVKALSRQEAEQGLGDSSSPPSGQEGSDPPPSGQKGSDPPPSGQTRRQAAPPPSGQKGSDPPPSARRAATRRRPVRRAATRRRRPNRAAARRRPARPERAGCPVQPELGDALGLAGALGLADPPALAAAPGLADTPVPVRVTVSEWLPSRSCQWKT